MLPQGLRVSHLPLLGHAFIVYTDHQLALQVLWKDHLVSLITITCTELESFYLVCV